MVYQIPFQESQTGYVHIHLQGQAIQFLPGLSAPLFQLTHFSDIPAYLLQYLYTFNCCKIVLNVSFKFNIIYKRST